MQALFFFTVRMILVVACKDREKITPSSRAARICCFCKKKVTSVVNRNLKTKQQSLKVFKLKFINFADFFRKNT